MQFYNLFNNFNNQSLKGILYIKLFINKMEYIKRRQNDPQYLKTLVDQKLIIIQQQERKVKHLSRENQHLIKKIEQLQAQLKTQDDTSKMEILNLNAALKQQDNQIQALNHDKSQYQFKINMLKLQIKDEQKQHKSSFQKLRIQYQSQKQNLNLKIKKLQKNLSTIHTHYNVQSEISSDKVKIIQDSNRNLRGFSNQKQQRMIIIQNQQYANEIQYQAKQIQSLLDKNQKLTQEIKRMKGELDLHKQIEGDLVKRSSLAQTLIKQLNKRIKQSQEKPVNMTESGLRSLNPSQGSSRVSVLRQKKLQDELNKLKFQMANLRNHSLYLENVQQNSTQKYQTLGAIMGQYLQNLLYFKQRRQNTGKSNEDALQTAKQVNLDLNSLKSKQIKQWKTQQLQTMVFLLINQVKPFLSKSSLITFPQTRNINISFIESETKDIVSLPKITQNYQKTYQKQARLNQQQNRFKDIPLDISTKILRSNLRQWGTKIQYGNMPSLAHKGRNIKSKSFAHQMPEKSIL